MADSKKILDITFDEKIDLGLLYGTHDKHMKLIEDQLEVIIRTRGEMIQIEGEELAVDDANRIIQVLVELIQRGLPVHTPDVVTALNMLKNGNLDEFIQLYEQELIKTRKGQVVRVKNRGQHLYVEAVKNHDVVFGIGPAGTGKTFLAVVLAVLALKKGEVQRIILTRPAVEAGESLGFLPGDLKEKVDPYLRPVYDALHQIFGVEYDSLN